MSSHSRRRRCQFSLRTLLASTLVLGALLGWIAIKFENARRQRAALAAIERFGGKIQYVFRDPPSIWKCALIDDEVASEVCSIQLPSKRTEAIECLKLCKKVRHLRGVNIKAANLEAADLADLRQIAGLQTIAAISTPLADEISALASSMPNLCVLQFMNASASDEGVRKLAEAKGLVMVAIIGSPEVGDDGLATLARLPNLRILSLERTSVTDAGLAHLEKLTTLRRLNLTATSVTAAGIAKLRESLPDCKITGP